MRPCHLYKVYTGLTQIGQLGQAGAHGHLQPVIHPSLNFLLSILQCTSDTILCKRCSLKSKKGVHGYMKVKIILTNTAMK